MCGCACNSLRQDLQMCTHSCLSHRASLQAIIFLRVCVCVCMCVCVCVCVRCVFDIVFLCMCVSVHVARLHACAEPHVFVGVQVFI